jgi:Mn-dependent DtxR family transcriptional regulator
VTSAPIPDAVRLLIERDIRSVGELETLLLMRRTKDRTWEAEDATRALRATTQSTRARLDHLARRGYLRMEPDGYRYVADGERDGAVRELDRLFKRYRSRIIGMIFD